MVGLLSLSGCELNEEPKTEAASSPPGFCIPHAGPLVIDGKNDDWVVQPARVEVLHFENDPPRQADFQPAFSLAWNDDGLLLFIHVKDDLASESSDAKNLWQGDSVELFIAEPAASKTAYQVILAPGRDAAQGGKLRTNLHDFRDRTRLKSDLKVEAASVVTADGYALEVLLPWANLGIQPANGLLPRLQVYVNDRDAKDGPRRQARWHPLADAQRDASRLQVLTLAQRASPPVRAVALGDYSNLTRTVVHITAVAGLAGQAVHIRTAEAEWAQGTLSSDGDWAVATLSAPMPCPGKPYGTLVVTIDREAPMQVQLPDADQARKRAYREAELNVRAVFSGNAFPPIGFKTPGWIETLGGPFEMQTTYLDAAYQTVSKPEKPGRYGAVVRVKSALGERVEFLTLYRMAENMGWREWQEWKWPNIALDPTPRLGLERDVLQERGEVVGEFLKRQFAESFTNGTLAAVFLTGLRETAKGEPVTDRTSPWSIDARWWFGYRKHAGLVDTRYLTYVPPDYEKDPNRKWPLLVFLHGSGERGDDLERVKVHGPPKLVAQGRTLPFIVISPQCPNGRWWLPAELLYMIDQVSAKYRVDQDRVYLTGLSMGGFGTWTTAMEAPERFAAIAPICGGGDVRDVERLKGIPTWVFHGGKDPVVPLARSDEMVKALKAKGGTVGLTVYPDAGHDSWTATYENEAFYQWLLANRRGAKPVPPPEGAAK
jgi:predicted esterase